MPLYEFRCPACAQDFEILVRGDEQAVCPSCGTERIEKLLSAASARNRGKALGLPINSSWDCPSGDAPPCGPGCCRLP